MSWKEVNKNNKKKAIAKLKKEAKPFSVKHYRFFPCVWSKSLKDGFVYYLAIKKHNCYLIAHEFESPRFKTESEAREFAENNEDTSFIPA